jgi:hypothetical protein
VVVNTTVGELPALLELLRVWDLPDYVPLAPGEPTFRLVVLLNQKPPRAYRKAVNGQLDSSARLRAAVSSIELLALDLPRDLDRYVRGGVGDGGEYGWKSGPNLQFFRGLDRLTAEGGFALVVETDTRPVRAGWVGAARDLVRRHPDAWVLGSVYRGLETVPASFKTHLNGNAIYALSPSFAKFRREVWEQVLREVVRHRTDVAYDYVLSYAFSQNLATEFHHAMLAEWHRLVATDFIQNLVHWRDHDPMTIDWVQWCARLERESPQTYVVHGVRGEHRPPWT